MARPMTDSYLSVHTPAMAILNILHLDMLKLVLGLNTDCDIVGNWNVNMVLELT